MDKEQEKLIQRHFYRPFCSEEEINRIFNVQTSKDYLLKLRADKIADNMRLFRVYRNKVLNHKGKKWTLEKSFKVNHYRKFFNSLKREDKIKCKEVVYGDIFSKEPQASIIKTNYGPVVNISQSLEYFLKFMNLCLLDFEKDIPGTVRINSLRIALRIMQETEALDFLMDPRGIIPSEIEESINNLVSYQLQFIVGHEFAHYILGHLGSANIIEINLTSSKIGDESKVKIYTNEQTAEFEADLASLTLPNYDKQELLYLYEATILFFASLELYEHFKNCFAPPPITRLKTHPEPLERIEKLLKNKPLDLNLDKIARLLELVEDLKEVISEDVSLNYDFYEIYGSAYLSEANTEWRGKELIDRVDYY